MTTSLSSLPARLRASSVAVPRGKPDLGGGAGLDAIVRVWRYGRTMADFTDTDLRGSRFERADLSGSQFLASTKPVEWPGWPRPASYPVSTCLRVVLNEEWEHRLFAERDLAALEAQVADGGGR
jgi:Pentapeptide repeats (8 copies)